MLGYKDTDKAIRDHCKYPKLFKPAESAGLTSSPRGINIIPESDLYRLIMRLQLPNVEPFREWVTEKVLPSIRKHGFYGTEDFVDKVLNDPESFIKILKAYQGEKEQRAKAEQERDQAIKTKMLISEGKEAKALSTAGLLKRET